MLTRYAGAARCTVAVVLCGVASACSSEARTRVPAERAVAVRETTHLATAAPPAPQPPAKAAKATLRTHAPRDTADIGRVAHQRPRLLRADPASADLASGNAVDVTLYGTGFTRAGNVVTFNGIELGSAASDDGRRVRFTIPTQYPAHGEVPPRSISAGTYAVTVTNQNGVSDTLTYLLRSGPP